MQKRQGLSLRRLGSNGLSARAVEQLLHQLRLLRRRWQMKCCPTKTKTDSESDLGRLGLPARTGQEAQLLGAGDQPAIRIPEAVSAAITAARVVEWRLMIEANTCRKHWQNGVGNEKSARNLVRLVRY